MRFNKLNQNGFTLIEVTISVALFVVLAYGMISLVSILLTVSKQQGGVLSDSDDARKVAFKFMNEIRNSSSSNVGAYQLAAASNQSITFYSNIDGGVEVEKVRYFLQNGELIRGVIKPTGSPYTYVAGNEVLTTVQKNVANGGAPLFYYYDGNYDGVTNNTMTEPINITQVRYIRMDMKIYNKAGRVNQNTYTVSTGGALRNVKDNYND